MADYLDDKTTPQLIRRLVTFFGGMVVLLVLVGLGQVGMAVLIAVVIIIEVIHDATEQILHAVEHHHECPVPGCITQRGHLGGHVIVRDSGAAL